MALLEVENLQTHFRTPDGVNRAVDGVSFEVAHGETLAIVGESGCGKSVTAMSILRLVPEPPGKIAGTIRFDGRDLLTLSERAMRDIRGNAHQHDLPGADDEPQSGAHHRPPARRNVAPAPAPRPRGGAAARGGHAQPRRHRRAGVGAPANIRTSCRAACGSG